MLSSQIRKAYLEFFASKDHLVQPSYPLVPKEDPTLLFTSAGMVPFKDFFAGIRKPPHPRITTVQKCLRESDLENVGYTARHHTFFEMLGNFSFGDYFKKEAIEWAWEFVTKVLQLPKDRLYVTVFETDDEAAEIWKKIGIPESRIVRLGKEDNWWGPAGETGPCGPCSEILYDQGEEVGCGKPTCGPGCDCDRFLEIWNLVFTQYFYNADGSLSDLPQKNIDTGMGLERIAAVMQGVYTNFDTDLFKPIMSAIEDLSGKEYGLYTDTDVAFRVIADHIRALVFSISEGVVPTNEGRGYVIRRLLRRAVRYGRKLNLREPFLYQLVSPVVDKMKEAYPEIVSSKSLVSEVIKQEEERFLQTLERGLAFFEKELEKVSSVVPGEVVFKLFDTYGFPPDIAQDIAKERGLKVDWEGFEKLMEEQRERARRAWKGSQAQLEASKFEKFQPTEFIGYENWEGEAEVIGIFKRDGDSLNEYSELNLQKGEEIVLILDRTVFYAESGGQVSDEGIISKDGVNFGFVFHVQKPVGEVWAHSIKIENSTFLKIGDKVHMKIDLEKRKGCMRAHTATHLLHKALQETIGEHAKQAGSLVEKDYLRFDFTHTKKLDEIELKAIEKRVFEKILENLEVEITTTTLDEARKMGAMALFDYKYSDKVRLVNIGGWSLELCGGTHCKKTGDIGMFLITTEGSVASGVRRIEAYTGKKALALLHNMRDTLIETQLLLGANTFEELPTKAEALNKRIVELKKELAEAQKLKSSNFLNELLKEAKGIKKQNVEFKAIVAEVEEKNIDLKQLADQLEDNLKPAIVVLLREEEIKKKGKVSKLVKVVAKVSKELTELFHAGNIVREVARIMGGGGGGKPNIAEAGGRDVTKISEAIEKAWAIIEEA